MLININRIAIAIAKWNVVTVMLILAESNMKLGDKAAADNMNRLYDTGMKSKYNNPLKILS